MYTKRKKENPKSCCTMYIEISVNINVKLIIIYVWINNKNLRLIITKRFSGIEFKMKKVRSITRT